MHRRTLVEQVEQVKQVVVRFDDHLSQIVRDMAAAEERSVTQIVEMAVRDAVIWWLGGRQAGLRTLQKIMLPDHDSD